MRARFDGRPRGSRDGNRSRRLRCRWLATLNWFLSSGFRIGVIGGGLMDAIRIAEGARRLTVRFVVSRRS
jgi:hypothetical protein